MWLPASWLPHFISTKTQTLKYAHILCIFGWRTMSPSLTHQAVLQCVYRTYKCFASAFGGYSWDVVCCSSVVIPCSKHPQLPTVLLGKQWSPQSTWMTENFTRHFTVSINHIVEQYTELNQCVLLMYPIKSFYLINNHPDLKSSWPIMTF